MLALHSEFCLFLWTLVGRRGRAWPGWSRRRQVTRSLGRRSSSSRASSVYDSHIGGGADHVAAFFADAAHPGRLSRRTAISIAATLCPGREFWRPARCSPGTRACTSSFRSPLLLGHQPGFVCSSSAAGRRWRQRRRCRQSALVCWRGPAIVARVSDLAGGRGAAQRASLPEELDLLPKSGLPIPAGRLHGQPAVPRCAPATVRRDLAPARVLPGQGVECGRDDLHLFPSIHTIRSPKSFR